MKPTIRDAYISVEIDDRGLEGLRDGLRSLFGESGVECERASSASHVSIAYGEGDVEVEALERVASEIAALPFSVHVAGFEILEGETTPFDYLVVALEGSSFGTAQSVASGQMKTRTFAHGFRSHVSLLKFPKGGVKKEWAEKVLQEMNGCQSLARFFGQRRLRGCAVTVFGSDRQCCLMKSIAA
jgi:hypothetical protein